ncbi:MAG: homocysteine S-methyltransferase family protein [Pseudomonadota bacterium]
MGHGKYRDCLPQLNNVRLLTDGGIETTLIFDEGLQLPYFAAFTLLGDKEGRRALYRYYERYCEVARARQTGFVLDSATWRASADWGQKLGYTRTDLDEANRNAVALLFELRKEFELDQPFVISGNIGPRGDGYVAETVMTAGEAEDYHYPQVASFDAAGVDMVSAITMTHAGEAAGIAQACARRNLPLALSFTVETDGRLPSGQQLSDAILEVDSVISRRPAYYMINCAHPDHFRDVIEPGAYWSLRIAGLRANASRLSHAELDEAEELDDGSATELAEDYANLLTRLPNLRVFGGCCGTNHNHVDAIAGACLVAETA